MSVHGLRTALLALAVAVPSAGQAQSPAVPAPAGGAPVPVDATPPPAPTITVAPPPGTSVVPGTVVQPAQALPVPASETVPIPSGTPATELVGPPVPGGTRSAVINADGQLDLVESYQLGRENDPTFRAAVAERQFNRATADQTLSAILPSASYSLQNIPTESGTRQVVSVTQPLVSVSALATFRQRGPRRAFAEATLEVRDQDLASRTLTAVVDIIRASEASALNEARIDALSAQAQRANRLYEAGLGTVTDAREIQVRYEQALANRILLNSDQTAAEARFRSITGVTPSSEDFRLPERQGLIRLEPVNQYLMAQSQTNPQVAVARQTQRINELEAQRARGSLFPTLGATATYSNRGGQSDSYVGFSVSAPINAGTFYQAGAARATVQRAVEERRQVEERARTELERFHALVSGGQEALQINAKAIEAAELSVEANSKSYEGGVRTSVDVVNAIQTVFEVKNSYVTAATQLAINYLNVQLLAGVPTEEAMRATQAFLLAR